MKSGALLINKHEGITSFGVIDALQKQWMQRYQVKKRDVPKLGHGGTLDPFATGLLVVCVGRAVKLSRYFLGSIKEYEGIIKFGETTIPGDPTAPISETTSQIPSSREEIQSLATTLTLQPYLQTPPMFSAKKKNGKPLYELAREGIEIEREAKACQLHTFEISHYEKPKASFRVVCSAGTYIRTLTQDLAKMAGSLGLLEKLNRTASGSKHLDKAWTLAQIEEANQAGKAWHELPCWVPFDGLLDHFDRADATEDEAQALKEGRQKVLFNILRRGLKRPEPTSAISSADAREELMAIYCQDKLVAIASRNPLTADGQWGLDRVFNSDEN
jgi:tRNA pseudouridine55 synthase